MSHIDPGERTRIAQAEERKARKAALQRQCNLLGFGNETQRAIMRLVELNPVLEEAVFNIAELAYADGADNATNGYGYPVRQDSDLQNTAADLKPDTTPKICPTCHEIHNQKESPVIAADGTIFWPGHEYIIETLRGTQKLPRTWRMGYLGYNEYRKTLEFDSRPAGGSAFLDLADIKHAEEVRKIKSKRSVPRLR